MISLSSLAGCSLLTGFADLDFDDRSADSSFDARMDARRAGDVGPSGDADAPDTSSPDAMRDAVVADASVPDMTTDAPSPPADAADMFVAPPCGECPAPRACTVAVCGGSGCTLELLPAGVACDDGNPCTEGSRCDGAGQCVGGTGCPASGNVCRENVCTPDGCRPIAAAEALPCGPTIDYRCCSGACVDTRVDANHCGSCTGRCIGRGCVASECATVCTTPSACASAGSPFCREATCGFATGCIVRAMAGFCLIDGACYANGEVLGDNPCLQCDVERDVYAWSTTPAETPCDDGLSCTTGDRCDGAGRCRGGAEACGVGGECSLAMCVEPGSACSAVSAPDGAACADGAGICCAGSCRRGHSRC